MSEQFNYDEINNAILNILKDKPSRFRAILARTIVKEWPYNREHYLVIDRQLQKLRRDGKIVFLGGQWSVITKDS